MLDQHATLVSFDPNERGTSTMQCLADIFVFVEWLLFTARHCRRASLLGWKAVIAPEAELALGAGMANGPARAEFWKEFVTERCMYPFPERLRAQLADANFSDFCECGCNSFSVRATDGAPPLTSGHDGPGHRSIHEADFKMADERTLEIILFANVNGDLDYVEVDCCANSYPVPDLLETEAVPFHTWTSEGLLS